MTIDLITITLPYERTCIFLAIFASRPCPSFYFITTLSSSFTSTLSEFPPSTSPFHPLTTQSPPRLFTSAPPSVLYTPHHLLSQSDPLVPHPVATSPFDPCFHVHDLVPSLSLSPPPPLLPSQPRPCQYHLHFRPTRPNLLFVPLTPTPTKPLYPLPPSPPRLHLLCLALSLPSLSATPSPSFLRPLSPSCTPPSPAPAVPSLVLSSHCQPHPHPLSDPLPPIRPRQKSWTKVPCSCKSCHHPRLDWSR